MVSHNDHDVEIQGVIIQGHVGTRICKSIALILVYRPPRGNSEEACFKIKAFIANIPGYDKKDIILLGDFNWNVGEDGGAGFAFAEDISIEFGLIQLINCPTRSGLNNDSTIDLIFTNTRNVIKAGCLDHISSDHYPTYMVKKRKKSPNEKIEIRRRKMSNYNSDIFSRALID